jgi:hypothetical protein
VRVVFRNGACVRSYMTAAWREDSARRQDRGIKSEEKAPLDAQTVRTFLLGGYIPISDSLQRVDNFRKPVASEVLMLLGEVGKLREERRALQQYVLSKIQSTS